MKQALTVLLDAVAEKYAYPVLFRRGDNLMLANMPHGRPPVQVTPVVDIIHKTYTVLLDKFLSRAHVVAQATHKDELLQMSFMRISAVDLNLVYGHMALTLSVDQVLMGKPWMVQGNSVFDCTSTLICEFSGHGCSSYIREAILLNHLT